MKNAVLLAGLTGLLSLVGCGNKVNFSQHASEGVFASQPNPDNEVPPVVDEPPPVTPPVTPPVEPPPVVTPPVVEPPVVVPPKPLSLKNGTCAKGAGNQILSCLSCASKDPIIPPPLLSRKAQELLDIMTVGCAIHNKSDPSGYVAPTHEDLLKRLIQCSPTAYQDTAWTGTQSWTINRLLTNAGAQHAAFGGLYYNAASTDFETYFGLEIGEARYTFCRGDAAFSNEGVYPREYYDSLYSGLPYTLPPAYVKAQRIRNQLRNCMAESLRNPHRDQPPTIPGETCSYETAEGDMSVLVIDKVNDWKNQGLKVYYEGFNQCGELVKANDISEQKGNVKIAVKKCQAQ